MNQNETNSQGTLIEQMQSAKGSAMTMSLLSEAEKNEALGLIERELLESTSYIIEANKVDLENGKEANLSKALMDRLTLNHERIMAMAQGIRKVMSIADPIGKVLDGQIHSNGMRITKIRVPLGVIGIIYEARPNVTTDAIALCIKSGNACVLRGSQQSWNTNLAIMEVVNKALKQSKVPMEAIQYLNDKSRESAKLLLKAEDYVDLVIPRGGNTLKKFVNDNALIPVLGAGGGLCHVYIDKSADPKKAVNIAINAKTHRPGVCNACETILIHREAKDKVLLPLIDGLIDKDVVIVGDQEVKAAAMTSIEATDEDWGTEYLDLKVSIKIVDDIGEAIEHINKYSTGHSDAIVTEEIAAADIFKRTIDSSCVYVNASTRFTDGEEFGFGAEIGISTQKMHARGPIGLTELCTYKYIIDGSGQTR